MAGTFDETRLATLQESVRLNVPPITGYLVGLILYGAFLVAHIVHVTGPLYKRRKLGPKVTVWLTFIFLTTYEGIMFADTIYYTVIVDRSIGRLRRGNRLEPFQPLAGAFVAATVQTYLAARTASLLQNRWKRYIYVAVLGAGILAAFIGAVMACVSGLLGWYKPRTGLSLTLNDTLAWWCWCSVFCDVLISGGLVVVLRRKVSNWEQSTTDSLLRRLMKVALTTAMYTAVVAVAAAISASVLNSSSFTGLYLTTAFWAILPPCYGISLYTTIATRRTIDASLGVGVDVPPPRWDGVVEGPRHGYTGGLSSTAGSRDVVSFGRAPLRALPSPGEERGKREEKERKSSREMV